MTVREVVKILRRVKPKTADDAIAAGIPLKFLDKGCSREVYRVRGLKMVVKFPYGEYSDWDYSVKHAQKEIASFRRIQKLKSCAHLWKHLPEVYYEDFRHGIIAMKHYRRNIYGSDSPKVECLANYLKQYTGRARDEHDYGADNFGIENGVLKILDLGLS